MNHAAQRGITRGEVEIFVVGFFLRASFSCFGVTRYEEKETLRCVWSPVEMDMLGRKRRAGAKDLAAKAMVERKREKEPFKDQFT